MVRMLLGESARCCRESSPPLILGGGSAVTHVLDFFITLTIELLVLQQFTIDFYI